MTEMILVDNHDRAIGQMEKLRAHREARLHRCFSILVFNKKGEMLLQLRAKSKYHCGGLWTNACCSHPRPGEETEAAAHRRLVEEMGFDCPLEEKTSFIYRAPFSNGLTEHEFDHVFTGRYDGAVKPNPEEADDYKWIETAELLADMKKNPAKYTPWFRIIMGKYQNEL